MPVYIKTWTGTGPISVEIKLPYNEFEDLVFADTYKDVPKGFFNVKKGSTIITFTEAYLSTLADGTYFYIAEFKYVDAEFELIIERQSSPVIDGDGDYDGDNPATGDDPYTIILTTWLAILSALCMCMLGIYYRLAYSNPRNRK